MQTYVKKWGNSLAIRIPLSLSRQLHLSSGSLVEMTLEGDSLVIQAPRYTLDGLLSQINENNLHSSLLDDQPIGNEEW